MAPPDWQWPTVEGEPLLFVGQINCAELRGAELLPPSGLLVFPGDYDAVHGSDSFGASGVYLWPDVDRVVAAKVPTDSLEIFPARLLLQVTSYCNGEELHGWGPGGSLYYLLPERDLRARVYEGCEFEGQFT